MRWFNIGILCGAAFLATACNQSPENKTPADLNAGGEVAAAADEYFTVRPGPVANAKLAALSGTFQMLKVAAPNGIPSDGRGGACLVFAAADLGLSAIATKTCNTNLQCKDSGASAAYCDMQTHSCWVRPATDPGGAKTCNRPITMSPTVLNPVPLAPADAAQLGIAPGAKVRVVACLQKTGAVPGPNGTGCASPDGKDRIEVMGPFATVKA